MSTSSPLRYRSYDLSDNRKGHLFTAAGAALQFEPAEDEFGAVWPSRLKAPEACRWLIDTRQLLGADGSSCVLMTTDESHREYRNWRLATRVILSQPAHRTLFMRLEDDTKTFTWTRGRGHRPHAFGCRSSLPLDLEWFKELLAVTAVPEIARLRAELIKRIARL